MNVLFQVLALATPLLLALVLSSRIRAVLLGTLWVWIVMVVASLFWLATDLDYNSVAPGIALIAGWVPGLLYSTLCVLTAILAKSLVRGVTPPSTTNG